MFMKLSDIAILSIKGTNYCCMINGFSKNEAINFLKNVDMTEKSGTLQNIRNSFSHVKIGKEILTFGNTEIEKY